MTGLDSAFAALNVQPVPPGGQLVTLRVCDLPGRNAWIALGPDNTEHLILDSSEAGAPPMPGTLTAYTHTLTLDDRTGAFLDISCATPALAEVFEQFCAAVVEQLPTAGQPVDALRSILERWRRFLVPGVQPSRERVAAVVGELTVLHQLCQLDPTAVTWWTGPSGARHDFRHGGAAIEVKTTLTTTGLRITVNGADQLQAPDGGRLHLHHVRLEAVPDGSLSAPGLVELILARGASVEELYDRLTAAGLPPAQLSDITDTTFEVRGRITVAVDDQLPRIVPASFTGGTQPAETGELTYQIDLGPHLDRALDEPAWQEVLADLAAAGQL